MAEKSVFIKEVQIHQSFWGKIKELMHSATKAAGIMLIAAIASLIIANSGMYDSFLHVIHTNVGFMVGDHSYTLSVGHIINDVLMSLFFLLVGLEIKYEMTVGELTNIRQALLPIVAAFGGVIVPVGIYLIFNASNPETSHGWGVPTATDIAFALGIMALLGNRIPSGIRIFLSTLAVADDIIAILVIAIFYGHTPDPLYLALAAVVLGLLVVMNRSHIYALAPYLALGVVLWLFIFLSGVHATIAGVLLALTIPSGSRVNLRGFISWSDDTIRLAHESFKPDVPVITQKDYIRNVGDLSSVARQVIPPATRLERQLYPLVYFAILPLFALANADVSLVGADTSAFFTNPVLYGVMLGLLVGKPLGIMLFSFVLVKSGLAKLPENVNWMHMLGASILGGVGFTMAIFVSGLAFHDPDTITTAKAGILIASTLAGILGFMILNIQAQHAARKGVSYLTVMPDNTPAQTFDEEAHELAELVAEDAGVLDQLEAFAKKDEPVELVVTLPMDTEESLVDALQCAWDKTYRKKD